MSLLELLVAMIIATLVCAIAYSFYRKFMGDLQRQKQVTSLQNGIREAVESINRYLVAGGVAGDSLFFDPHRNLDLPFVNGGHRVVDVATDSSTLSVYGNFSGSGASIASPILDKNQRWLKTDKAALFKAGGFAYIYAGSAQEVIRVASISDSVLRVKDAFFTYYPKGTLIFPLERVRIYRDPKTAAPLLKVVRERADGVPLFAREFNPTSHADDSLEFKVKAVDRQGGQISYSLTFAAKTRRSHLTLARRSDQTVFLRGF